MNTALIQANYFQLDQDIAALVMDFDTDWLDQEPMLGCACAPSTIEAPHPREVARPVQPIDFFSNKIDILWQLDNKAVKLMATSSSSSLETLERLATHPMADVRAAVSENENTPLSTLWALSKDCDPDVRYQLAENHNLPLSLIRFLTSDENPYVACRAQKTYDRLQAR